MRRLWSERRGSTTSWTPQCQTSGVSLVGGLTIKLKLSFCFLRVQQLPVRLELILSTHKGIASTM